MKTKNFTFGIGCKKVLAKASREQIAELNRFLASFKVKIFDAYREIILSGSTVDGAIIRDRITGSAQSKLILGSLIEYHKEQESKLATVR